MEGRSGLRNGFCIGFALILTVLATSSFAQNFRREYRDAKDYFEDGDYTHAMDGFKPLIAYDQENPYSQYASYYYGLSAVKLGFATVAKDIFLQIRKLYPDWEQIDQVNYVLAKVDFDQHEYFRAMLLLTEIKDLSVALDVTTMKRYYLAQLTDPETLRMMMEEYPGEVEAARALVKAISL